MHKFSRSRRDFIAGATSALALFGTDRLAISQQSAVNPERLDAFATQLDGVLVTDSHAAYDSARRTASFNPRFDRRPLAMVGCRSEDDIVRSILFAREHALPLAVRSGGHDVLAASVCDGGLVIDLRYLVHADLNNDDQTIRVGAGAVAATVNHAAGQHGLAVPLGCNSSVGVSGLTLGGGLGWFVGSHGATCDSVTSARVITADGTVREVSDQDEPELFWAIRGGGGNFGVVSEWSFRTHAQHDVWCGGIIYPGELTRDFLAFYREFMAEAPDELTVEVIGNNYNGQMVAAAVCFSGDERDAKDALRPLRAFGPPVADGIVSRPYAELESMSPNIVPYIQWQPHILPDQPLEHGSYWQGTTVSGLTDDVIDAIDNAITHAPAGWSFGLGHVMRGACTRVPQNATPLLRIPGATTVHFDAGWPHRSQAETLMQWVDESTATVRALGAGTPDYVNYLSQDDVGAVRKSYGIHYQTLAQLKRRYDPTNVFRQNRNIQPA